jgi:hypothetical protein
MRVMSGSALGPHHVPGLVTSTLLAALLGAGCSGLLGLDEFEAGPASGEGGSSPAATSSGDGTTSSVGETTTGSSTATGSGGEGGSPPGPSGPGGGGNGGDGGAPGQGGAASTGGGGAGGEPPTCDLATHDCVTDVPDGWAGPMALYGGPTEGSLPACGGSYPTTVATYNGDLDPGEAACDCSCAPATGIACGGNARLCYRANQSGCNQACLTPNATLTNGVCTNVSVSSGFVQVLGAAPTNPGACQPQENHVIPTPAWGTEAKACSGAETTPLGCAEGEICAPQAVDGSLCISRGGDAECPDGVWSTKRVFHESFSDTRACSACSCGGAQSTCGGGVTFSYGGNTCDTDTFSAGSVPSGGCASIASDLAEHASYTQNPSGTCPPQGGMLSGQVTTEGTITFCCTN